MKSTIIRNYIDNKINTLICNNESVEAIVLTLLTRINANESSTNGFKKYIAVFSKKRIYDLLFIEERFGSLSTRKQFSLVKLRDKLIGIPEIEIAIIGEENRSENESQLSDVDRQLLLN